MSLRTRDRLTDRETVIARHERLRHVEEDCIFIKSRPMADALRKRKVAYGSSRHGFGATTGINYHKFLARMKEYKRSMEADDEERRADKQII